MSTYTSIDMPFTEAVAAFNAVMVHASKDDFTPVIRGVYVTAEGSLVATDRYTVGRYKPEYDSHDFMRPRFEGDDFGGAILPLDAVKWVAKMRATQLSGGKFAAGHHAVRFVFDSSTQSVLVALVQNVDWERFDEHEDASDAVVQQARFSLVGGNFPPVDRLFPNESTQYALSGPISLKMEFVSRIATATKWLGDRSDVARFQFTKTDNPNKPGPVYVQVGERFDALIQPNLLLR
jgi:hypothetical protein